MKLFNAFSIQMLPSFTVNVHFREVSVKEVQEMAASEGIDSYIGHADTANIISRIIGAEVPCQRRFGKIEAGEYIIIAQVVGGRLPEGCTVLPEGMQIKFIMAHVA